MSQFDKYAMDAKKLNNGVKLHLRDHEGKLTEDWVRVKSIYSYSFQKARMEVRRLVAENPDYEEDKLYLEFQAAMVKDWSNDLPCTADNVKKWLETSPHEGARIEEVAETKALFFPDAAPNSLNGADKKSGSSKNQKDQTEATVGT